MAGYAPGEKEALEKKAADATEAAKDVGYNTSAAGLGAYAKKMAKPTPTPRPTPKPTSGKAVSGK